VSSILSTPKGQITFRIATPEDASQLLALRLESLKMQPKAFAADIDQTNANGEKAFVDRIVEYEQTHTRAIVIALAGTELIGMAGIVRGHWPKMRHGGSLWGVYVKPAWRGLRVDEGVVNGCTEWAIENNLVVIYLSVTVSEISAIRCYTRCDFKEYGVEPRSLFYDGHYFDQMLMVKMLD
jgi:ribosomal protein S18 acetylase RimI-like enzyme